MKRAILLILLCVCCLCWAGPIPPYVTPFMRTVNDDATAGAAATTLGLGVNDTVTHDGLVLDGTIATGLDMSGGTFATAVQNWPATPVINVADVKTIKFDDTNYNVFAGTSCFNNAEGQYNIGIGYQAGYNNDVTGVGLEGDRNVYIGYMAGKGITPATKNTGYYNCGIGYGSLYSNTSGSFNFSLGPYSLYANTTGQDNVGIGVSALESNTSGSYNIAIGPNSSLLSTTASYCVAIGEDALYTNNGSFNIGIGYYSLFANTSGTNNIGIGYRTLRFNTTASSCIAIGESALFQNNGSFNIGVGYASLGNNTTGINNIALGYQSLKFNQTGNFNSGFGRNTLYANGSGSFNTACGFGANFFNTDQSSSTAIGSYALLSNNGTGNTAIGYAADWFCPDTTLIPTAVVGAGLEIGNYRYRVSFVLDGVETALSDITGYTTTTAGNQQIDLTVIPTYSGPKTCTARKLYRTKANPDDTNSDYLFYYIATISDNSTTTYSDTIPDADLTVLPSAINYSIMLGYQAKAFVANEMVIGSNDCYISNLYLGEGVYATTPHDVTINATGGSGTNNAGAGLILAGGKGTGSAAGGSVIIQTAAAGAGGTGANSLSDHVKIDSAGITYIGDAGTTNYTQFAANGDQTFAGTAGFYPRFLTQADEPAAGTGATQCDTSEMVVWKDSDDSKVYLCFNDGGTVKSVELP